MRCESIWRPWIARARRRPFGPTAESDIRGWRSSLTDPQAAWTAFRRIRSIFAYHANYLLDHKAGIIVDADGNRANRIEENRAALEMLGRVADRFGLTPKRLAADTALTQPASSSFTTESSR